MHHTYLNSPGYGGADLSAEIPDMDFVTDANVYYNLPPPPPPPSYSRSALSLPPGYLTDHQHHTCPSSSCPSSPKLPPTGGNRKGKALGTRNHRHQVGEKAAGRGHLSSPKPRGSNSQTATERGPAPHAASAAASTAAISIPADTASPPTITLPPPPVKDRIPPTKTKKLSHTRSFDLDHIYQNLVRVASKPRSNSFSVPWRRKKKTDSPVAITGEILEEATGTLCQTYSSCEVVPDLSRLEGAVGRQGGSQGEGSPNSVPGSRSSKTTSHSSCSSSSSTSSGSDSETGSESAFDDPALISPGITYLRDGTTPRHSRGYAHEVLNACYHSTATLPLRNSGKGVLNQGESRGTNNNIYANNKPQAVRCSTSSIISQVCQTFDVAASLDEWRRKEKWLEKKRSSRNLRQAGESGEVHIVILYAQDGADWKNYLCELFTQMVPKEEGCQAVRVEVKNVEEIEDTVGGLEAVRLKEARLQIVIISPRFMAHIAGHGRSEIGQLFEPEKVLGLLLGVNDSQFSMAHLSALYSYKDWHRLKVRNSDLHFVEEVLCEAIKILNKNKLYVDFLDERAAKFKVSSRKITMTQKQLYIILNDEVAKSDSLQVFIEVSGRNPVPIQKYHLLNPYTIWFTMPEEFLKTSSILQINILVNGVDMGSRQLKCESHMDTLRDILACVANPTEFMCQALNINPICEDLDMKLAEKVKHRMPLTKIEEPSIQREVGEFPTWIHFSSYYGLERLTWALLEVPGAEEALTTCNCFGHTPSILAYKKGFYSLAQKLEDVVVSKRRESLTKPDC